MCAQKNSIRIIGGFGFFLFVILCLIGNLKCQNSLESDYEALQDLYAATNGDRWYDNSGWSSMTPETMGQAVGVEVNAEGRVVAIDMQTVTSDSYSECAGNNLSGNLPSSIGNLAKLEVLKLKTNKLRGEIPATIGNLESLRWLALGGQRCDVDLADHQWNENNHQGSPNLYSKKWEETNEFSGPIPPEIGQLSNLELLEIRRQYLTGTIPPEMGQLEKLVGLFLNDQKGSNPLGGSLPPELGNLSRLKHLHLDNRSNDASAFTGDIPQQVTEGLTELRHVRLRGNNFTGEIPTFNTHDLRVITMNENDFTGEFPIGYFQGENPLLNNFLIGFNNLSGDLPTNMIPATYNGREYPYDSMSKFGIDGNDFTGPVPEWMQEMSGHQVFDVKSNNLSGAFPDKVMDQEKLKTFLISNNKFSGPLPDKPFASSRMLTIYAQNNDFTGPIPESWESLTNSSNRMLYLYLNDNQLEGEIPGWLADITGIKRIYLYDNKLTPKDILPHRAAIAGTVTDEFDYLPQKPFGAAETVSAGATIDRSRFAYDGNRYQWYKDGAAVDGETSPTIDTGGYGSGTYQLQITHPDIDYTFESEPIEVQ